jgi:hypothetical protein
MTTFNVQSRYNALIPAYKRMQPMNTKKKSMLRAGKLSNIRFHGIRFHYQLVGKQGCTILFCPHFITVGNNN